jgi:hypothetical protein
MRATAAHLPFLGVSVQSTQHPDASMHHDVATFGGADQATEWRFAIPQGPDRPSAVS